MYKKHYRFLVYILFWVSVLIPAALNITGCNNNNSVIKEEKFIRIYTDIIIAKDTAGAKPEKGNELLKKILLRYNVTEKKYKQTIDYYNQNPEKWRKFFDKAIQYAEELKKKNGI